MADIIQANHDQLADVAKRFGSQSETITQTLQTITRAMDKLQGGDWIGRGSDAFFTEMASEVLPGVRRLVDALSQAGQMTTEISALLQQADEEASTPFRNGSTSGFATANTNTNNTNMASSTTTISSKTATNLSAIDRFAALASAVYPAEQGSGNGNSSWQNGTFTGKGLSTNDFATLVNERGFSAPGTLENRYGPGFGLATGDGFGSGSTGLTSSGNNFGIPRDWLAGVTGDGNGSLNSYLSSNYNDHGIPRDWLSGVHDAMNNSERASMHVPRDWLSGVMDKFNSDLDSTSASSMDLGERMDGGSSGSGGGGNSGGSGSSDGGGSSGGASGGEPTSESPTETSATESQSPMSGGSSGTGTGQSHNGDSYGRGGFAQGYSQTTISAASGEEAIPSLRYQPTNGSGIAAQDPPLARVEPTTGWSGGDSGTMQAPANPGQSGLHVLSLGLAAVSPLLALAGKLVKDKLGDE